MANQPQTPAATADPTKTPKESPVLPQVSASELLTHSKGSTQEWLSNVLSLNDAGMFHEPTCRFCSSPHRASAEDLYKNQSGSQSLREITVRNHFLAYNADVSLDVIRNHLKYHLDRGEDELRKIEYIGRITALNAGRITTHEQIKLLLSACAERLTSVGSIKDESQRTKDVALIVTAATKLLTLMDDLTVGMSKNKELVKIPKEKFRNAFDQTFAKAKTPNEKALLSNFLNELIQETIQ